MIIAMGFTTSVIAQVPETRDENPGTQDPVEQQQQVPAKKHSPVMQDNKALPQDQNQLSDDVDYSEEMEANLLPATITASLVEKYPNHEVVKVFKGSDKSYKLKIKDGDAKSVVIYDESGTFVKEVKDKDKATMKDKNKDW